MGAHLTKIPIQQSCIPASRITPQEHLGHKVRRTPFFQRIKCGAIFNH